MTTNVFKRAFTIDVNDTYVLNVAIPDSDRRQTLEIALQRVGAYDGTLLVQARPRGSSLNFQTIAYKLESTGATQASALGAADALIEVDATGLEVALTSSGRTVNSLSCYVVDVPEQ